MRREKATGLTREIIGELFDLHYEELYLVARRYLDEEGARDIVQDVFLKLTEKGRETEIHTSLRAYLRIAVVNSCLNHLKHKKKEEEYALSFKIKMLEDERTVMARDGHMDLLEKEALAAFRNTVKKLPERNREIFKMSRFELLTNREIAERLGISIRTVETQIYRALKVLSRELKEYLPFIFFFL